MISQFGNFGTNRRTVQIELIETLYVAEIVFRSVDFTDHALSGSGIKAMNIFLSCRLLLSGILGHGFTDRMIIANGESSRQVQNFFVRQTGTGVFKSDDSGFAFGQSACLIKGDALQCSAFFKVYTAFNQNSPTSCGC